MLDINLIRKDPDRVRQALTERSANPTAVDEILALDARRRAILTRTEQLRAMRNTVSKQIGQMQDEAEREAKKAEMRHVGDEIAALEGELARSRRNWMNSQPACLICPTRACRSAPMKLTTSWCASTKALCLSQTSRPNPTGRSAKHWALLTSSGA